MTRGDKVRDGGLQPERTTVAWRRTTLNSLCVTALAVRAWFVHPSPAALLLAMSAAVLSTMITATAALSGSRDRHHPYENLVRPKHLKMIGASLAGACMVAITEAL